MRRRYQGKREAVNILMGLGNALDGFIGLLIPVNVASLLNSSDILAPWTRQILRRSGILVQVGRENLSPASWTDSSPKADIRPS